MIWMASPARVVYEADTVWEAPNWSRDGRFLLSNSGGKLYRIPVDGGSPQTALAVDPSLRCNNDHDLSPDGTRIAISASSPSSRSSQIYVADADGSHARLVVAPAPSYFHGWSPDGKYLSFVRQPRRQAVRPLSCARRGRSGGAAHQRSGVRRRDRLFARWQVDLFQLRTAAAAGTSGGYPADGAGPDDRKAEQVTSDDLEDWFPHPSPDGKWLLFLSFPHGTEGHNDRNQACQIRMIADARRDDARRASREVIVELHGGTGHDQRQFLVAGLEALRLCQLSGEKRKSRRRDGEIDRVL